MLFVCVRPPHSSPSHSRVCCLVVATGLRTITDITDNTVIRCDPHLWVWTTRTSRTTRRAGNPIPRLSACLRQYQTAARSNECQNEKNDIDHATSVRARTKAVKTAKSSRGPLKSSVTHCVTIEITLTRSKEEPQILGGFLFALSGGDDT